MTQRVDDVAEQEPREVSPRTFVVIVVAGIVALSWLFMGPLGVFYYLAAGWAYFLARVGPRITFNIGGVVTALAAVALLVVGLHMALTWLYSLTGPAKTAAPGRWRPKWTMVLSALVLVAFASGVAALGVSHQIGLPIPLSLDHRPYQAVSRNNLTQFGLAAQNHHATLNTFSPGYTTDASGRPLHGWQAHMLPFLEQDNVFKAIRFDKPWDDEANRMPLRIELYAYQSPRIGATVDAAGYGLSDYAGNVRAFPANRGLSMGDIRDGTTNTLMFGEVSAGIRPWGYPLNLRDPAKGLGRAVDTFGGSWPGGTTHFALFDGSVRAISPTVSSAGLKALATPAGGERIDEKDW